VSIYTGSATGLELVNSDKLDISIFPNPSSEIIAIQQSGLVLKDLKVELYDMSGKLIQTGQLYQGSTISYFDVSQLQSGEYLVRVSDGNQIKTDKIILSH
jgi:hypothetical protein